MTTSIQMEIGMFQELRQRLSASRDEQVIFLFAQFDGERRTFQVRSLHGLEEQHYEVRNRFHVSVRDDVKAKMIRAAGLENLCLIEAHSHPGQEVAQFSDYDLEGLRELVPHLWWRLQGRPYAALIFGADTFDALSWVVGPEKPTEVTLMALSV